MNNLEKAKSLLKKEKATLVAVKENETYVSHARGVAPILQKIDEDPNFFNGASVADKVIGKAAAMLLSKYGVSEIHAVLMSEQALEYLKNKPIEITFDSTAEYIINRDGTDMCPMEKCVLRATDEAEAEILIRKKLQELSNK